MNRYRGCTHGCIYCDSRTKVIEDIHKAMKHIEDDELVELSVRVAGKYE